MIAPPIPRRAFRIPVACALLSLLTLAAACGGARQDSGDEASGSGPDPAAEDTLTVLYIGDERILSPVWDMPAKLLVFQPLVERDRDWKIQGLLARSWEHSEDYREWTFHLRTDVRWHDGEPLTARDVAFTYRLLQHPDVARRSSGAVRVEAVDDSTVRFIYPEDSRRLSTPLDTYQGIYPEHLLGDKDPARFGEWDFWIRPVGTGPFRYVRHVPRTMVQLEANPDYFRGEPAIDRLILKFASEAASGLMELRAGNVDALGWPGRMAVLKAREDDRFRTYYNVNPQWTRLILWKVSDPRFEEASVRRALTHAVDRRELLRVLNLPPDLPLVDAVPTRAQYVACELPEPLDHDPPRARRMLAVAGWQDVDGNGVRERDGRELRFELLTGPDERQAAVYVQSQLAAVGVRAEVAQMEASVLRERMRSGKFSALLDRISPGRLPMLVGEESVVGFHHERGGRLVDRIAATLDPERRDSLHCELIPILREHQPATFLFPQVHQVVAHRRVRGLSSPYGAFVLMEAEHLWVEEEP